MYRGRYIFEWGEDIAQLKRAGEFETALQLAQGCMGEMIRAARHNPANVMEHYVIQVAIIQHKMKNYAGEARMLEEWLAMGFPAPREDFRLDVHKRLAKAHELWAKAEGRDPSAFYEEWKRLVALAKEQKQAGQPATTVTTGSTLVNPELTFNRGRSAPKYVPSHTQLMQQGFVAVDFETANRSGGASACQIALVKVWQGQVVDRFVSLLKPPPGYDRFEFTHLHGIGKRQVKGAPSWPQVVGHVASFVGEFPVYAHNASFDARVWRELDAHFGTASCPEPFFCSYRMSQRFIPGLPNYKLPTVVKACAPAYKHRHHKADSDAEACALIVTSLQQQQRAAWGS